MSSKNTLINLDHARDCRADDPLRALSIADCYIAQNPEDSHGYFSRHLTLGALGRHEEALANCNRAIELDPDAVSFACRAMTYRELGDYKNALADLNQMHDMDPADWLESFGPHFRSDTLARLGKLDEALADADLLEDDHWMPEHSGLPGGNKQEFIAEIRRRAMSAKQR